MKILDKHIKTINNYSHNLEKRRSFSRDESKMLKDEVRSALKSLEEAFRTTAEDPKLCEQVIICLNRLDAGAKSKLSEQISGIIHRNVIRLKKVVKTPQVTKVKQPPPIGLKVGIFWDMDATDHNGAIRWISQNAVKFPIPFITTRSTISGSQNKKLSEFSRYDMEKLLLKDQDKWDIYEHLDPKHGQELLVFLPKSYLKEKSGNDKLKALDFNHQSLKKITVKEALSGPKGENKTEALYSLFTSNPKATKLFHIAGHGSTRSPAGLNREHYIQLLNFLKKQNCKGLSLTSCYSGGGSGLVHLPKPEEKEKKVPFPVVVRSIGDFPTIAGQLAEEDFKSFFDAFEKILQTPGKETVHALGTALQKLEEGKSKKVWQNLAQVYFPPSKNSPGGFRPLGEGGKSYSLTYGNLKQKEILKKEEIPIKNQDFIELHPLIVNVPLTFERKDPILLSMVPGKAHHLLHSVKLAKSSPLEFLKKNCESYKEADIGVSKGFIIGNLSGKNETIEQLFLRIGRRKRDAVYCREGQYYSWDGDKEHKISAFQFALKAKNIVQQTKSKPKAVRSATGGQESEKMLQDALKSQSFWTNLEKELTSTLTSNVQDLLEDKKLKATKWETIVPAAKKLSKRDRNALLFHLITQKRSDLAFNLFKNYKLSPNIKNEDGIPLVSLLARNNDIPFLRHLINDKTDLNLDSPAAHPLTYAVANDNKEAVMELLNSNKIEIDKKDKFGKTALFYAYDQPKIFSLLIQHGADIDQTAKNGKTVLSNLCRHPSGHQYVENILKAKADPNAGTPSPLFSAVVTGNEELVNLLLRYKANPFQKVEVIKKQGPFIEKVIQYPFLEAISRGSIPIVKKFLGMKNCHLDLSDGKGRDPLTLAMLSNDIRMVPLLLEKGARLSDDALEKRDSSIERGIKRMKAYGEEALIKKLIRAHQEASPAIFSVVYHSWIETDPDFIAKLAEDGLLPLNSFFSDILREAEGDMKKYEPLLRLSINKGANINQVYEMQWNTLSPLAYAAKSKNKQLTKLLLDLGASPKEIFSKIIKLADLDLVKLAITKGASIQPKEDKVDTPLHIAARISIKDNGSIFEYLLSKGAPIKAKNKDGITPFPELVEAASRSKSQKLLNICKELITSKKASIDEPGRKLASPFTAFILRKKWGMVDWCLSEGATIEPKDTEGKMTPLQAASTSATEKGKALFKDLLKKGGDLNKIGLRGVTPFIHILRSGDLEMVKFCFENGAELKTKELQEQAFKQAVLSGNPDVIKLLIKKEVPFTPTLLNPLIRRGYNAGGKEMLDLLMELKTDPDALEESEKLHLWGRIIENDDFESFRALSQNVKDKNNPMKVALSSGKVGFVKELENLKVKLDYASFLRKEGLHLCSNHHTEMLEYLLDHIKDQALKQEIFEKNSLVYHALSSNDLKMLELLAKHGADFNKKSANVYPIIKAVIIENLDIIKFLLNKKVNLNVKTERFLGKTKTVLEVAKEEDNKEIITLLKEQLKLE